MKRRNTDFDRRLFMLWLNQCVGKKAKGNFLKIDGHLKGI